MSRAVSIVFATLGVLAGSTPANADIVRLSNGRTLTVDGARFEGDVVILLMRGGGEIRAPKDLVDEILPDEVPYARVVAIEALERARAVGRPATADAEIWAMVEEAAARHGVDSRLAHALVRTESNYDIYAMSPVGAMGLMQLMPGTAKELGVGNPFDPEQNLDGGMRHLRRLLSSYALPQALAAYNAGEGAVARYGGIPPYRETQRYVRRILSIIQ